jgi:hypothetical protein
MSAALCSVRTPDKRRPGQVPGRTPGLLHSRGTRTRSRSLYARISRRCPALRAGCMGASEGSYRLFSCRRCAQQVRVCRHCDRGNQYCAAGCARIRRRESLRRAGDRYQQSYHGACRHAARQRAWRARQVQKVTHQGSQEELGAAIVSATSISTPHEHADPAAVTLPPLDCPDRPLARVARRRARCSFCRRRLSHFGRFGPLRGGP